MQKKARPFWGRAKAPLRPRMPGGDEPASAENRVWRASGGAEPAGRTCLPGLKLCTGATLFKFFCFTTSLGVTVAYLQYSNQCRRQRSGVLSFVDLLLDFGLIDTPRLLQKAV